MVIALLLVHVADVEGDLVLALLDIDLHVLQLHLVVADLVHQVAAVVGETVAHVGRREQGRGRGRRGRQVEGGVATDVLLVLSMLLLDVVISQLHLALQVLVGLLLGLTPGLVEDGLLHDHPHHVLVAQVLLAELQRTEDLLPLGRDVFSIEGAVSQVEGDGGVLLEGKDLGLLLLLGLLPPEEVLDLAEEAVLLLLPTGRLDVPLAHLLVLLEGGTVREDLHLHEFRLGGVAELEGDAALGVLEHVEGVGEGTVELLEAVVDLDLEGEGQRLHVVDAQET